MNDKPLRAVLLSAGSRANVYASTSLEFPDKLKIVGSGRYEPLLRFIEVLFSYLIAH